MGTNWAYVGGGIGRGISEGVNDLQGMERQQWMRRQEEFAAKQRAQAEAEMQEETAIREKAKGIRATDKAFYDQQPNVGVFKDDEGNAMPGVREVARPVHEIQADQAALYTASTSPRLAAHGNALAQASRQGRDDVRAQGFRALQEKALAAHNLRVKAVMSGDMSAVPQMVEYYNQKVPDGFQALFSRRADGGANVAFMEEKTGRVVSSKMLTPAQTQMLAIQASKDLLEHELSTVGGVEGYNQAHKRGIDQGELDTKRGLLEVAQSRATVDQENAPAQRGLLEAQAGYYQRMPRAASGRDHAPQWQVLGPDTDGAIVAYDRTTNTLARPDGKPVQNPKAFAKVSGEREAPAVDPKRREAAERAYADAIGDAKRLKEVRAAYPDIFGPDPRFEKYGALGPDTEEKKPAEKKKPVDKKTSEAKGVYNRFRQQTPEERMSSMTHK